ncbi:hypothetical protein QTN47_15500 [Danxiaibacter flavus]|uniref:Uncharacterized protein n=1 Tax=Danxiaibacter flavus TaxID=3049108 RepID=A0ABV3ZGF9_9BACT|nr:hypothetical protein QNM32_15510 [Chitinophagaceae bacterium DXS]
MKRIFLLSLLAAFTSFSCSKKATAPANEISSQERDAPQLINGRLVFSDERAFYEYVEARMSKSADELAAAGDTSGFKSLYLRSQSDDDVEISEEIEDLKQFNFPLPFLFVINQDGEVQIGDYIVWYSRGKKYFISKQSESMLSKLKENPDLIKDCVPAGSSLVQKKSSDNERTSFSLSNALDARHQKTFFQINYQGRTMNGDRKYVHEIITYYEGNYPAGPAIVWRSYIYLRIKLEWKGRNGNLQEKGGRLELHYRGRRQ